MSQQRIASRYARPIFDLAEEHKVVEDVKQDMETISEIGSANRDFTLMLSSPIIAPQTKASILDKIFKGKVADLTLKLLHLLASKNRAEALLDVAKNYIQIYNAKMGLADASVTTSYELSSSEVKMFQKLAENITGKKVALDTNVDKEIIGGFKLFLGDKQIDKTVAGQLKNMKLNLTK